MHVDHRMQAEEPGFEQHNISTARDLDTLERPLSADARTPPDGRGTMLYSQQHHGGDYTNWRFNEMHLHQTVSSTCKQIRLEGVCERQSDVRPDDSSITSVVSVDFDPA